MAIQLGRAIGLQGGIPQSNLPQMIQKIGDDVSSTIAEEIEKRKEKADLAQKQKDAILANIDFGDGIDGSPEDMKDYDEKRKAYSVEMISEGVKKDKTPTQLAGLYKDRKNELDIIKRQAEKDWKAHNDASVIKKGGKYHIDDYEKTIQGVPEQQVEEDDPAAVSAYNDAKNKIEEDRKYWDKDVDTYTANTPEQRAKLKDDINKKLDEKLAELKAPEKIKKTIGGQKPYFETDPLTRYKSGQDLNTVLQKSMIHKSVGVLPAMVDYQNNFKPESLIDVHKDNKGVIVATPDLEKIKNAKDKYVLSMTYQGSYGENHDIEKGAVAHAAMQQMESDNVPEEERPARFKEYVEHIAGENFDRMMETTINEETRKTNEARLLKEAGSGAGSKEPKIAKMEGAVSVPAIEQLKRDKIAALQLKIDDGKETVKRYRRQGAAKAVETGENALKKMEETIEVIKNHKPNTSDVYVFSDKEQTLDPFINLYGDDKLPIKLHPTTIFKMNGVAYLGGVVNEEGVLVDKYVPYNTNNKGIFGVNKEKLLAEFDKKGFKTIEEQAASKSKGSSKGKSRQEISDQELENF